MSEPVSVTREIADLRVRGAAQDFDETIALARAALARVTATDEG